MAYISQEKKKELWPGIKKTLDKYGLKGSLSIRHHNELVLTIRSGKIDFIGNYKECLYSQQHSNVTFPMPDITSLSVNIYHFDKHFSGEASAALEELISGMKVGWYDNSEILTDYFDIAWYLTVDIGKWNKPYILT